MSLNREAQRKTASPGSPKMKINTENPQIEEMTFAEIKRKSSSSLMGSPKGLAKSTSARCLCSPTTHAGSFRCRYHRNLGLGGISRAASLGSNLSLLGTELAPVSESKMNTCE